MGKGDKLASGGISAVFGPGKFISDKKWAEAFDDFNPEEYRRNALLPSSRVPSINPREATKR